MSIDNIEFATTPKQPRIQAQQIWLRTDTEKERTNIL